VAGLVGPAGGEAGEGEEGEIEVRVARRRAEYEVGHQVAIAASALRGVNATVLSE